MDRKISGVVVWTILWPKSDSSEAYQQREWYYLPAANMQALHASCMSPFFHIQLKQLTGTYKHVSADHDCVIIVMVVVQQTWSRLASIAPLGIWFGKWRLTWSEQVSMHDRDVANIAFPGFLQAWPLTVLATSDQPILVLGKFYCIVLLLLLFMSCRNFWRTHLICTPDITLITQFLVHSSYCSRFSDENKFRL